MYAAPDTRFIVVSVFRFAALTPRLGPCRARVFGLARAF